MLHLVEADCRASEDDVLRAMFAARKDVFVDLLGWDVPILGGRFEIDQFDDEHANYLVVTGPNGGHRASARLLPTTAATTLRKVKGEAVVIDGPFAETKEQFLGFYTLDCADLDEAVEFARELSEVNPSGGSYEIRPVSLFNPAKVPA